MPFICVKMDDSDGVAKELDRLAATPDPPCPPEERSKTEQFLGDRIVTLGKEIKVLEIRCDTGHLTRMELIKDVRNLQDRRDKALKDRVGLFNQSHAQGDKIIELQNSVKALAVRCNLGDHQQEVQDRGIQDLNHTLARLQSDFDVLCGMVTAQSEKIESKDTLNSAVDWKSVTESLMYLETQSHRHARCLEGLSGFRTNRTDREEG